MSIEGSLIGVIEVMIFMISLDCSLDYDGSFWQGFDKAMQEEWNMTSITAC